MKARAIRKYYTHFLTLLSLSGFMLFCFSNCEQIQLVPIEIEDHQVSPVSAPETKTLVGDRRQSAISF